MSYLVTASAQIVDLPADIQVVPGGAEPQQQWPHDILQIYEPRSATPNYTGCTAVASFTGAGVWGHDEGPSVALADGRILWMWGDTVTAYATTSNVPTCTSSSGTAYQLNSCAGLGAGSCLGVDTVSYISASDVSSKIASCHHLKNLDNALIAGATIMSDYANCPQVVYITTHTGSTVPKVGFTYESLDSPSQTCQVGTTNSYNLCTGEDMLAGHTATGLFTLSDGVKEHLYSLYQVESQNDAGFNFRTESILLRTANDTSTITSTVMPQMSRWYTFSRAPTIPTGQLVVTSNTGMTATVVACPGYSFSGAAVGQSMIIQNPSGASGNGVYTISSVSPALTVTPGIPGSPPTSCGSSNLQFDLVPNQDSNPGKFMFTSPEIITSTTLSSLGIESLFPSPLNSGNVVCFWGSSFFYRHSNVYLACGQASDSALTTVGGVTYNGGVTALYYFTGYDTHGKPQWEQPGTAHPAAETDAVPLLSTWTHITPDASPAGPCVGELSVRWISALNRFMMTYGSYNCGGLQYRTATAPWGPWSAESQFFSNDPTRDWEQRLIYSPGASGTPDFNTNYGVVAVTDPTSHVAINMPGTNFSPFALRGNPYGAYQYPGSTAVSHTANGTVTVFMNVSGFNPYVSWQTAVNFYTPSGVRFTGHVVIAPKVLITH